MTEVDTSRARRLKAATHGVHDGLDQAIMKAEPFASRDAYADFLRVQQLFHRDIAALYDAPELANTIPDLADRRRYQQVCADLADLGAAPAPEDDQPRFGAANRWTRPQPWAGSTWPRDRTWAPPSC